MNSNGEKTAPCATEMNGVENFPKTDSLLCEHFCFCENSKIEV